MMSSAAGSVNFPFEDTPSLLPKLIKQCQQLPLAHSNAEPANGNGLASSSTGSAPQQLLNDSHSYSCQASISGQTADVTGTEHGSDLPSQKAAGPQADVIVVCRRGNDSQHTVQLLREHGIASAVDLAGGLLAWSRQADPSFPEY